MFSDSFAYSAGDLATVSAGAWTRVGGAAGNISVVSSGVLSFKNTTADSLYYRANGSGDHYVKCTVANAALGYHWPLIIRAADANNYVGASWGFGSHLLSLYQRVAGSYTLIGSAAYVATVGDSIVLSATGSALTVTLNGTVKITATNTTGQTNALAGMSTHDSVNTPVVSYFETGDNSAVNTGSASVTEPIPSAAGGGDESITAASQATEPVLTTTAAGGVTIGGTGGAVAPTPTTAASGLETTSGAGNVTAPVPATSAAGAESVPGAASAATLQPTTAGAGQETIGGSAEVHGPLPTTSAQAGGASSVKYATAVGYVAEVWSISASVDPRWTVTPSVTALWEITATIAEAA